MSGRQTIVDIDGDQFRINGELTYAGRKWKGNRIEGLLLNSRMVQGIFDDYNPETVSNWDYPDGNWDADRNTREFVAAMEVWKAYGLNSFTINLQGGSPFGYSHIKEQVWENTALAPDGSLRDDYMARLERILDKADELGMAVILGIYYFGQDQRMADEQAVIQGVKNTVDWVIEKQYTNVIIEIANEFNIPHYDHTLIGTTRCKELITLAQHYSEGRVNNKAERLLVSISTGGNYIPDDDVVEVVDFVLLHGNGVKEPSRIREMVEIVRNCKEYRGQPIVFNEDDHFDFDQEDNNFVAAVSRYAGWGYFDYRMEGEGYDDGYQSVPVNWGLSSARKQGFFRLLAEMTGSCVEDDE